MKQYQQLPTRDRLPTRAAIRSRAVRAAPFKLRSWPHSFFERSGDVGATTASGAPYPVLTSSRFNCCVFNSCGEMLGCFCVPNSRNCNCEADSSSCSVDGLGCSCVSNSRNCDCCGCDGDGSCWESKRRNASAEGLCCRLGGCDSSSRCLPMGRVSNRFVKSNQLVKMLCSSRRASRRT